MKRKDSSTPALHMGTPSCTEPKHSAVPAVLLDVLLTILYVGGLTFCANQMYQFAAPNLPLLTDATLCGTAVMLLLKCRKMVRVSGLSLLGAGWSILLFRRLQPVAVGSILAANRALNTMSVASKGKYDFGSFPVSSLGGYTRNTCILLFLLFTVSLFSAAGALLIHQKRPLLCTLLFLMVLTPALSMTIAPPAVGIVPVLAVCTTLFALHTGLRRKSHSAPRGWLTLPAALLTGILLCNFLHPEAYIRPQKLETVRGSFENAVQNLSPRHAYGGLANSVSQVDMSKNESVSFSGKTMLRVSANSDEAQYLKSFTGSNYQNSRWTLSDGSAYQKFLQSCPASMKGHNVQTLMAQYEQLIRKSSKLSSNPDSTLTIQNIAANSRCLFLPYGTAFLPNGSDFDRDLCARFQSIFGKNQYSIPIYACTRNNVAISSSTIIHTGNWPVFTPVDAAFAAVKDSVTLTGSLEWMNSSNQSPHIQESLKLLNSYNTYGWYTYNSFFDTRPHDLFCYTDAFGVQHYILGKEKVDSIRKQLKEKGTGPFQLTSETELDKGLTQYYLLSLRDLYTMPLCPSIGDAKSIRPATAYPIDLKKINSAAGTFFDYEYAYRKAVYDENTQVPETLRPMLLAWLRKANYPMNAFYSGYSSNEDTHAGQINAIVTLIAKELAQSSSYTLSPGAPPEGTDFIDYFLNTSHRGYCVHFATAETLLLRTLGIPARYAEGYYIPSNKLSRSYTDVTDDQAHAWVEVYAPGRGWIPFEATPGYSTGSTQDNRKSYGTPPKPTPRATVNSAAPSTASKAESPSSSMAASSAPARSAGTVSGASAASASGSTGSDLPWVLLLLCLLAGVAVFLRHTWVTARRKRAFTQADTKAAGIAVYTYLQFLTEHGVPLETEAQQLCEKALFSKYGLTATEMKRLRSLAADSAQQALAGHNVWERFLLRWIENI